MKSLSHRRLDSIRMGAWQVGARDATLRTLVGSCIGLALYDRKRKVGGLAHIVLPDSRGKTDSPGKFVDTAIPALIRDIEALGGPELKLIAKFAGGANMFQTAAVNHIGAQNIQASERVLETLRIPVLARHCGGSNGRRMLFNVNTGGLLIEIVGRDPIEL